MPEIFGAALMGGGSGRAYAAIGAIYPAGATCTCSYGGKTIAAKDTSGRALFLVPTAGQWLVKATSQTQEAEDTVSITTQGQVASVTLAFFSATIQVTFPTDCTQVTCKKDSVTFSVPSGSLSSGSYTFNIPETGEWVLYATNGTKEKSVTVSVIEEKAYSAKLSFELILYDSGSEYPEITGAWEVTSSSGENADACSITKNAKNMDFFAGYHSTASFSHSQPIDMSGYATLHILGKFDDKSSGESGTVGVSTSNSGEEFNASVSMSGIDSGNVQRDVDLSNVNTNAYFKIYMENTCQFTASKIWLD